jgi:hypothetical protein
VPCDFSSQCPENQGLCEPVHPTRFESVPIWREHRNSNRAKGSSKWRWRRLHCRSVPDLVHDCVVRFSAEEPRIGLRTIHRLRSWHRRP